MSSSAFNDTFAFNTDGVMVTATSGSPLLGLFCFSRKWRDLRSELYYNSAGVPPMRKPRKNYMPLRRSPSSGAT